MLIQEEGILQLKLREYADKKLWQSSSLLTEFLRRVPLEPSCPEALFTKHVPGQLTGENSPKDRFLQAQEPVCAGERTLSRQCGARRTGCGLCCYRKSVQLLPYEALQCRETATAHEPHCAASMAEPGFGRHAGRLSLNQLAPFPTKSQFCLCQMEKNGKSSAYFPILPVDIIEIKGICDKEQKLQAEGHVSAEGFTAASAAVPRN